METNMNIDCTDDLDTSDPRLEWSNTYKGYVARQKWVKSYDELNGTDAHWPAPEDEYD